MEAWTMERRAKGGWWVKELRYSPAARALVALTIQADDSRDTRIRVRRVSESRYRQVRFAAGSVQVQDFVLATDAPVLYTIAWTGPRSGELTQFSLFRVDLRSLDVQSVPIVPKWRPRTPPRSWIWKLLGVNSKGTNVYVALGRERRATPSDRRRLRTQLAKFEPRLTKTFGATFSEAAKAAVGSMPDSLDYVVVDYSVVSGKIRDLGLLRLGVA
jgi:hypothetical protein